jgi:hypothetical protein
MIFQKEYVLIGGNQPNQVVFQKSTTQPQDYQEAIVAGF